jgi:membrane peptidoglycan carboxypeptidase
VLKSLVRLAIFFVSIICVGVLAVAQFYGIDEASIRERAGAVRLTVIPERHFDHPYDAPIEQGMWLSIDDTPALLVQAVILREDRGFRNHFGVNPKSLARVGLELAQAVFGRGNSFVTGGSTITMQVARILYVGKQRSGIGKYIRKINEIFYGIFIRILLK